MIGEGPYNSITVDVNNAVAYIEFHEPEKYNPLGTEVMIDLNRAFEELEISRNIQAVVITGEGDDAFSSGGDIREYEGPAKQHDPDQQLKQDLYFRTWKKMYNAHPPIIAKINGYCIGGGLILASYTDLAISVDSAKFGVPTGNIGQIPGDGSTYRLVELIGERKTKELVYTADLISAEEAHQIGFLNSVVERNQLDDAVDTVLAKIKDSGTKAVKNSKRAINHSAKCSDIDTAFEFEKSVWWEQFQTEERRERVQQFLDE